MKDFVEIYCAVTCYAPLYLKPKRKSATHIVDGGCSYCHTIYKYVAIQFYQSVFIIISEMKTNCTSL